MICSWVLVKDNMIGIGAFHGRISLIGRHYFYGRLGVNMHDGCGGGHRGRSGGHRRHDLRPVTLHVMVIVVMIIHLVSMGCIIQKRLSMMVIMVIVDNTIGHRQDVFYFVL